MEIKAWIRRIVSSYHEKVRRGDDNGCDGFDAETCCCEDAVSFAVRALGNKDCEGSAEVLAAVEEHRHGE